MAKLTKEQKQMIMEHGRLSRFSGDEFTVPIPKEINFIWNATNSVIILSDLIESNNIPGQTKKSFSLRPHEAVSLKQFFTDEDIRKSSNLSYAIRVNKIKCLTSLDELEAEDIEEPLKVSDHYPYTGGGEGSGIPMSQVREDFDMEPNKHLEEYIDTELKELKETKKKEDLIHERKEQMEKSKEKSKNKRTKKRRKSTKKSEQNNSETPE